MRNCLLLALLIAVPFSFGFGYFDSITNGTPLPGLSPASIALGSSKAIGIRESATLFTNPAMTTGLPATVQGSFSVIAWTESVLQSDVDKTVRSMLVSDNFTGAALWNMGAVTLGAGYAKVAEFGYDGTHTLYSDPDKPEIGVEILEAEGGQWESMGSVAMEVTDLLSAGFSGGMRSARSNYVYQFNSNSIFVPDSSSEWSIDQSQFAWHAGIALNGELFKSGVCYSSGSEHMEESVSFGGSAYAEHLKHITVGFEAEVVSPFDANRFIGKLSVIMPLTKNLDVLTSASFDDQRVANRAGFGFGLGFNGHIGRVTLGGGILNRFRARRDTSFPNENADRVDDSSTQFSFGVSYSFLD